MNLLDLCKLVKDRVISINKSISKILFKVKDFYQSLLNQLLKLHFIFQNYLINDLL